MVTLCPDPCLLEASVPFLHNIYNVCQQVLWGDGVGWEVEELGNAPRRWSVELIAPAGQEGISSKEPKDLPMFY